MINSILFFVCSLVAGVVLFPVLIYWAKSKSIGLDAPDSLRKRHAGEIPRLGGIPIMMVVMASTVAVLVLRPDVVGEWTPIVVCSLLIFLLGLWDDLRPLPAKVKFIGQILIALAGYSMGLGIDKMTYPGGNFTTDLNAWSLPVTLFWLIAIPNIINLIDGFDGLAGGLGLFMAVTLGVVAFSTEQLPVAWFCFSLAGVLIAFLMFNFPPAKIFLGDGGAYLIGFCIAALSLNSSNKGSVAAVLFVTVVALGLPILDTLLAMIRRTFRGYPLFHADDEHIHHRLQNLGLSKRRILLTIYGVCVVLSLVGLSIFWSQGRTLPIAMGVVFLLALFAVRYLRYFSTWDDVQRVFSNTGEKRSSVRYALLQASIMKLEVDRCRSEGEFWQVFETALMRVGLSRHPLQGNRTSCEISLSYNGDEPLVLRAQTTEDLTEAHWRRVAQCFAPAYRKAQEKWHSHASLD